MKLRTDVTFVQYFAVKMQLRELLFPVQEVVAGLRGDGFFLAVLHHDLDLLSSQAMRLEEGAKIGHPVLAPMMDDDLFGVKLDEVQAAAPGDEPENTFAIARRQC